MCSKTANISKTRRDSSYFGNLKLVGRGIDDLRGYFHPKCYHWVI